MAATLTLPSHDGNTRFQGILDLTLDVGNGAVAITGSEWSGLRADVRVSPSLATAFSLAQVMGAVEGFYPREDGGWDVEIDQASISSAVASTGGGTLLFTIIGDDDGGIERAIANVTLPIHYGTTAP